MHVLGAASPCDGFFDILILAGIFNAERTSIGYYGYYIAIGTLPNNILVHGKLH